MSKKIVNNLFRYAVQENADGLVIEKTAEKIFLNYNLPGGEEQSFVVPNRVKDNFSDTIRQILKIAPEELAYQKYCKIHNKNYRLTFNLTIIPTKTGEKMLVNIINRDNRLYSIKQLGLQRNQLSILKKSLKSKSGLILITSPDGQGKSTTLYSLLQEINKPELSIYLLEKYPEYKLDGINQLPPTIGNWEKLLQYDSDIIALDDIENQEDFQRIFQAANSGRLVLASINANSSWEALLKILQLKMPLTMKLDKLRLIINQRIATLKRSQNHNKKNDRQKIGLFETLVLNSEMKKFIIDSKQKSQKEKFWEKLAQLALKNNFKPLAEDIKKKIKDGLLDPKKYK